MGKRRKSREIAVQVLYQIEIMEQPPEEGVAVFFNNFPVKDNVADYARELVCGVRSDIEKIDAVIKKFSKHWKLERMTSIDRNILRLALYEILHKEEIPKKVCINEAIEIAKKFGSRDSSSFINGILDAVIKSVDKREDESQDIIRTD